MPPKPPRSVRTAAWEFIGLVVVTSLLPVLATVDIKLMLRAQYAEMPLTELAQQILVGVIAAIFWLQVQRHPESRRFHTLVAGFFTCAFIRESDNWMEIWLPHSFWIVPVTIVAISAIAYAATKPSELWEPMGEFVQTRAWVFMLVGLVTLLGFSRILGSGAILWGSVLQGESGSLVKTVIQETLELFSYVLVAYGSWAYQQERRYRLQWRRKEAHDGTR